MSTTTRPHSVCCTLDAHQIEIIREMTPTNSELLRRAELLKAIAHPGRLAVIAALSVQECCVGDLASIVALPLSTVSQHVRRLYADGLAQSRRCGRYVLYSITPLAERLVAVPEACSAAS